MARRPHVALLIESSRAYGRGLLRGIAAYARAHGPWSLYHQERSISDEAPSWFDGWKGHGVIARIESGKLRKRLENIGFPVVDVRGRYDIEGIPLVETNDRAVTRLALDHLLERGFRHIAYCGYEGANYSERRLGYFRQFARHAGLDPFVFESPVSGQPATRAGDTVIDREAQGLLHEDAVARWIASLPKPVGMMTCNDIRGQQVLNACRAHNIAVPDDVAVIGVDNDETLCELADPPMTSVEPDTERIGYEAAATLDAMMRGRKRIAAKTFIGPRGVVVRQSTDVLAIDDREVAQAIRYIRDHACDDITVEDVLDHVPLSRTTLDRRFTAALGRTPKAEIVRVRLERARRLLVDTDYTLPKIAEMSGFKHAEYLSVVFKQKLGTTPGAYRQGARA